MVMCMPMQIKIASPRADNRPGGMLEAIRIIKEEKENVAGVSVPWEDYNRTASPPYRIEMGGR